MKKYYKAVFQYYDTNGNDVTGYIPSRMAEFLEKEFMNYRSILVDLLNPQYEKWNKEFDKLYPGVDGYSNEYASFLSEKSKKIYEIVNDMSSDLEFFSAMDPYECGDICARTKKNPVTVIRLSFKPV